MKGKPTSPTNKAEPPGDAFWENGGGNKSSSPSPPTSPQHQQSTAFNQQCRRRPSPKPKAVTFPRKEGLSAGFFWRWNYRYLVVLLLLYISGLTMCVGPFSVLVGQDSPPGSVYRSHKLFKKLWPEIEADNSSSLELSSVWKYKRSHPKVRKMCSNSTASQRFDSGPSGARGYLIIEANGGLNQQRSAICNAVAVAVLLDAILVIPTLEYHKVWNDPSAFGDIYDTEHFIESLKPHVEVVRELPQELMEVYNNKISNIPNLRVEAWSSTNFYLQEISPILRQKGVVRITPFANRLAMHAPSHIQLLRCITNYKALRFSQPISSLAEKLIDRMMEKSARTNGKYISVHLRFEEDMVAFSCCVYDGGESEKQYLDSLRERGWKGKFKRKDRVIEPGINRAKGQCPLTPLEVGLVLRGMGFDNRTAIYIASGRIFQAERYLAPLKKMFPLLYTKESLATPDELAPFEGFSSRLAALDYTVSLFSEVFMTTQGGNFPHFLMGHRRFLFDHSKTVKPDKQKLVTLLQELGTSWQQLKGEMKTMLVDSDRNGLNVPRVRKINRKTSIYAFPLPECSCLQSHNNSSFSHPGEMSASPSI